MEHSAQNTNNVERRGQRLLCCVEDRHHTHHMYTSLYIKITGQGALCSADDREHCTAQSIGSIAKHRGQGTSCT